METIEPAFILVIDDHESDIQLIQRAQGNFCPDCRLLLAHSSGQAAEYLSDPMLSARTELILLDLKIPGATSAFEVIEFAKANPATEKIPLIVFTSSINPADDQEALRRGANAFVVKPVDYDEYCKALSGIFEKWANTHFRAA
jgi:two-component system response regulator